MLYDMFDGIQCVVLCVFFFFKQKTAYEMRISDWSSDVCSSDLRAHHDSPVPDGPGHPHDHGHADDRQARSPRDQGGAEESQVRELRLPLWHAVEEVHPDGVGELRAPSNRDRKSTRLNSSHLCASRMPSSA